jgi:hypothetical protein
VTRHATQTFMHFITQVIEIVFNIIIITITIIIVTDVNIGSMPYMSSVQLCIFWTFFFPGIF